MRRKTNIFEENNALERQKTITEWLIHSENKTVKTAFLLYSPPRQIDA